MKALEHIVIFHPAAIGDAMLATPVAAILKRNFRSARITYWSHGSLKAVIKDMCPAVDDFVDYRRGQNIFALSGQLKSLGSDLFVDLSNSAKGKLMPFFSGTRAMHYKKRPDRVKPIQHATDNFVATIATLTGQVPEKLFPTVFPPADLIAQVRNEYFRDIDQTKQLIAIVPGVGKIRPNRAWTVEGINGLLQTVLDRGSYIPLLVGGPDESEVGDRLAGRWSGRVLNLCGKLNLAETAAILKECRVVVSGDTGPAHIAVAVGTPVVGLYGPTAVERSGPFGNNHLAIDKQEDCRCQYEKECRFTSPGTAGECMGRITVGDVIEKVDSI